MIHRLRRRQTRDRRQNAKRVTGQHDDVFRVTTQRGFRRVGDIVQRVGATHVGGQAVVLEIQFFGLGVEHHVLDDGAEFLRGGIDFGLSLGGQVDGFGIAATFEIEGATIRPTVLVITDQNALGIGGQGGFTGARQAKEHGGIDGVADSVVGRTVHRHHAFARQDVVQQGKDRFLVFTCVFSAADQDDLLVKVQRDHRTRATAVFLRVGLEAGAVDDGELGRKRVQFFARGAAQQVADEQAMPCEFGHHTHVQTVFGVGAAKQVLNEIITALHVLQHVVIQLVERGGLHRFVVFPPDAVFDRGGANNKFVLGRTPGVLTGGNEERAPLTQSAFFAFQGRLNQGGLHEVIIDLAQPCDSLIFQALRGVYPSSCHIVCSCRRPPYAADYGFRLAAPLTPLPAGGRVLPIITRTERRNRTLAVRLR